MADYNIYDDWVFTDTQWSLGPDVLVDSWEYDDSVEFTSYDLVDSWAWDDFINAPIEQYELVDSWTFDESVTVVTTDLEDYVTDTADDLHEKKAERTRRTEEREYGRVIIYTRILTCPKGSIEDYENGILAPGRIMRRQWANTDDAPSRHVDGPRVVSSQRQQEEGTAQDTIQVTYLAFLLPNTRRAGYNVTARNQPVSESALRSRIIVHGITTSLAASNMPVKGSLLDGGSAVCVQNSYNPTALPGRILVTSEYILPDEAVAPLTFSPMPLEETDQFPAKRRKDLWHSLYGDRWRQRHKEFFGS